jgi:cytochrome c553
MRGILRFPGGLAWAFCFIAFQTLTPATADDYIAIPQGWSQRQVTNWYTLSQGSRLIPLDWLRALEQPGSNQPFLDDGYIRQFRYLPNHAGEGLPIGFAIDRQDDSSLSTTHLRWKASQSSREKWVGMNCSACHSAEITYQGKAMRIEGGPTLADFQGFIENLNKALAETRSDPDKANRFAAKVLGNSNTPDNRALLDQALGKLIDWQQTIEHANATPLRYGFGRLDAFGNIFNKVALVVGADSQTTNPSNAPVSYPFLWNVPQHDKVQWNGIVANKRVGDYDLGALARNTGEVIGVFADVKVNGTSPFDFVPPKIRTSVDTDNLNTLETQLRTLQPPAWPTALFGRIDPQKWQRGQKIFEQEMRGNGQKVTSCADCHKQLGRTNLTTPIKAVMTPLKEIGTDIWMACNAVTRQAKSGLFNDKYMTYLPTPLPTIFIQDSGKHFGNSAAVADLLRTTVIGTIWANHDAVIADINKTIFATEPDRLGSEIAFPSALPPDQRPLRSQEAQDRRNKCLNGTDPLLAYKGRPLTGIWATAPYLHNGSVPTLYDLLLPPDQRPKQFLVGTREFDPVRIGYATRDADGKLLDTPAGDNSFVFNTRDGAGRVIDGNSNAGHDYDNAGLTDDDRWALVEYLKGL